MTTADFIFTTQWWFVFFVFGVVNLPLTILFFSRFLDKGYIFSKILAIAIVSYLVFLLGTLHLLAFRVETIIICLGVVLVLNLIMLVKNKTTVMRLFYQGIPFFLFEEVLFYSLLVSWAYVRAHEPSLHGLEKFMDFGFVNSSLRTNYPPVNDMWYTNLPINYYYFGHFITAVLTKLSFIDSSITYNLMIATLFSFSFTATFSLATAIYALVQKDKVSLLKVVVCGLLAGFIVTLGGNLHTIYSLYGSYDPDKPVPFWQLGSNCSTQPCTSFIPKLETFPNAYWYPNATRFIPYTIHEFPLYSFVVSDLHGHVIDIPFVLLFLASLFVFFLQTTKEKKMLPKKGVLGYFYISNNFRFDALFFLLLGFLLSIMYMTNATDGVIYLVLVGVLLLGINFKHTNDFIETITHTLLQSLLIFAWYLLFTLPFSHFFKPFVSGLGIVCAPSSLTNLGKFGTFLFEKDHCARSPLYMLVTLWGFFYFFTVSLLVFFVALRKKLTFVPSDYFILLLLLISTLLIAFPEFAYIKDIYPLHYRANTMFKFGYQAFIMLGIVVGYTIFRFSTTIRFFKLNIGKKGLYLIYLLFSLGLFTLIGIYPYFAISSYYSNLKTYVGLDGLGYLKTLYPDDYQAVIWLRKNIVGQPVILEGVGDSYSDYARISANTGLPTVVGWPVHEWLWRGSYDVAAPRISDVQTIYETTDLATAKKLLKQYNVKYAVVGDLERQKYPLLQEEKFEQLGKVIFQSGSLKIYQLLY